MIQSDLRVRHREETKNVTRLTMENVSLLIFCSVAAMHMIESYSDCCV